MSQLKTLLSEGLSEAKFYGDLAPSDLSLNDHTLSVNIVSFFAV